jgi:UDP-N-acetylglucosamine--N-acetylmuramyl-(pentapeptide) pyrophosphoryl-undecaprenol N-acetylglucosamine transferase
LVLAVPRAAHAINVAMVEAAARLASVIAFASHAPTGERDVEMVRTGYREAGFQATSSRSFYDMGRQLGTADVIVCRAGATTLAEDCGSGKGGDSDSAADRHRRSPAQERRGDG